MKNLTQLQEAIKRAVEASNASRARGNSRHAVIDQRLADLESAVGALAAELAAHEAKKKAHA